MSTATRDQRRAIYEQLIGQSVAGKYTITGLLGFGGMGAVYEAEQSPMNRKVALKVIPTHDPTAAARFEREAETIANLEHPNTVTVFDFGSVDAGKLYLAMEHLRGRTLTDLIRTEGPLAPQRVVHIAEQVCRSLGEAHRAGIIHRDVKPDNIFLITVDGDPDYVKVLDFGIAKAVHGEEDVNLTAEGRIVGTPRYMSPEQIMARPTDHRADIYSLGCIIFEMLVGQPPFGANSTTALMMSHAQEAPPTFDQRLTPEHLTRIPPALEQVVRRTMSKNPAERPMDTDELRQELGRAMNIAMAATSPRIATPHARAGAGPQPVAPFEHHTGNYPPQTGNYPNHFTQSEAAPAMTGEHSSNRTNAILIGIGVVLLVLLLAGLGVLMTQQNGDTNTTPGDDVATQPTDPAKDAAAEAATEEKSAGEEKSAQISILSQPAGASVTKGGKSLGVTPLSLPRGDESDGFYKVTLEGFEEASIYVDSNDPQSKYGVALEKSEVAKKDDEGDKGKKRTGKRRTGRSGKKDRGGKDKGTTKAAQDKGSEKPADDKNTKPAIDRLDDDDPPSTPKIDRLD